MWRGCSYFLTIHDQVAYGHCALPRHAGHDMIFMQREGLTAKTDQTFDIELVLAESFDATRLEDHDLTALRRTKVISHAVNKKVVTRGNFEVQNVLAFSEVLTELKAGTILQRLLSIVRREQNRVGTPTHHDGLVEIEDA